MSAIRRAATLPVAFFERPSAVVARELIGCEIISTLGGVAVTGRIVETEAYLGVLDPASHAWRGRRHAQNESLYAPPGTWYVYRSYGMHWCANLVCGVPERAEAVLLRAVEPVSGLDVMRKRRGGVADRLLASGPGRLTVALGMHRDLDGTTMRRSPVRVRVNDKPEETISTGRIGITRAADWPLRFVLAGTRWASRPQPSTTPRARARG